MFILYFFKFKYIWYLGRLMFLFWWSPLNVCLLSSAVSDWLLIPSSVLCIFRFSNFFFVFWGPHSWHMEVPRLGVCNLHHSSLKRRILKPLSEARNWTRVLIDTSQVCYHWITMETPRVSIYVFFISFLYLTDSVFSFLNILNRVILTVCFVY